MNSKKARLRLLAERGGRVPESFSSLQDFLAAKVDADAEWWIRATAEEAELRHRHRQQACSAAQVREFAADAKKGGLGDEFIVQRYLQPSLSGVSYIVEDWSFSAAISGPCEPLLRGGSTSALFARRGSQTWSDRAEMLLTEQGGCVEILGDRLRGLGEGILVEWILTTGEGLFHVDLKEVGDGLFPVPPFPEPRQFVVGSLDAAAEPEIAEDTSIRHLSRSPGGQVLVCRSGSPLAHLCVEIAAGGGRVAVEHTLGRPVS